MKEEKWYDSIHSQDLDISNKQRENPKEIVNNKGPDTGRSAVNKSSRSRRTVYMQTEMTANMIERMIKPRSTPTVDNNSTYVKEK